jgi:hypothetical protein
MGNLWNGIGRGHPTIVAPFPHCFFASLGSAVESRSPRRSAFSAASAASVCQSGASASGLHSSMRSISDSGAVITLIQVAQPPASSGCFVNQAVSMALLIGHGVLHHLHCTPAWLPQALSWHRTCDAEATWVGAAAPAACSYIGPASAWPVMMASNDRATDCRWRGPPPLHRDRAVRPNRARVATRIFAGAAGPPDIRGLLGCRSQ